MKGLLATCSRFGVGCAFGLTVLLALSVLSGTPASRADSPGSPVWIGNGITAYQACSDWQHDSSYYPNTTTPFSYYWSGQPWWWNNSQAHACWHNDEVGNSWWRAIDIPFTAGAPIYYSATINATGLTPGQLFTASSCGGVDVVVWTPNGAFAGNVHYLQMQYRNWSILGTSTVYSYYFPGQTQHTQYLGDVGAPGTTGCTNTGGHVHQAVLQGGWAQPTVNNNVATVTRYPIHIGW